MSRPRGVAEFFRELKRRRVFRVAVVYFAVAFVIVETADLIFPALGIPDWAYTLVVVLAIMGLPVALVLAWAFDLTPAGVERTGAWVDDPPVATRPADPSSIAVLPFANLGGDPDDEYFSDGITDDIIARVCAVPGLKVISRTSVMRYKHDPEPLPRIAGELGVAYVLEGSVRRTRDRVRIVAQLVDAATEVNLWAATFDRDLEDVFAIQTDVAGRVADALATELSQGDRERLGRIPTRSLDAYDLYLRARHEWNRRTPQALERSLELLERAVALDPDFALAHAAMADTLVTLGIYGTWPPDRVIERARTASKNALDRDPALAEALTARACLQAVFDWDWDNAERDFRRAIDADAAYPTARQWYAMNLLVPRRRFDEAALQLDAALESDPLSPVLEASVGILRFYRRNWDAAESALRGLLGRDPEFAVARYFLGLTLAHSGALDAAAAELGRVVRNGGRSGEALSARAMVHAMAGDRARALEALDALGDVSPSLRAQVHTALGEPERALDLLEEAVRGRAADLAWVDVRPAFDPLREHPRFDRVRRAIMSDSAVDAVSFLSTEE